MTRRRGGWWRTLQGPKFIFIFLSFYARKTTPFQAYPAFAPVAYEPDGLVQLIQMSGYRSARSVQQFKDFAMALPSQRGQSDK
jgi:hypothetical protein